MVSFNKSGLLSAEASMTSRESSSLHAECRPRSGCCYAFAWSWVDSAP